MKPWSHSKVGLASNNTWKYEFIKWGIKVLTLSDATNDYVKKLQVYTVKDFESGNADVGLSYRVCTDLMSGLPKELKLFTDSYVLFCMKRNNCCGTVQFHRKDLPSDLVITKV